MEATTECVMAVMTMAERDLAMWMTGVFGVDYDGGSVVCDGDGG